jgi:hypothetical protein
VRNGTVQQGSTSKIQISFQKKHAGIIRSKLKHVRMYLHANKQANQHTFTIIYLFIG